MGKAAPAQCENSLALSGFPSNVCVYAKCIELICNGQCATCNVQRATESATAAFSRVNAADTFKLKCIQATQRPIGTPPSTSRPRPPGKTGQPKARADG